MSIYGHPVQSRWKVHNSITFLDVVPKDLVKIDASPVATVNSKGTLLILESTSL